MEDENVPPNQNPKPAGSPFFLSGFWSSLSPARLLSTASPAVNDCAPSTQSPSGRSVLRDMNVINSMNGGEASATAPDTVAGGEPRKQFTHLVQDSSEKRCQQGEKLDRVSLASVSASESSYTSAVSVNNTLGSLPDLLQPEAVYKHSGVESDTDTSTAYESAGENERSVSVAENASFSDPSAVSSPYGNITLDSTVALDLSSEDASNGATTEATLDLNNTLELNSPSESGLSSDPSHFKNPNLNLSDLALSLNNLCLETPAKSVHCNKKHARGILDSTKKVTRLVIDSDVSADVIDSDLSAEFQRNPPSNEEFQSFIERYLASGDNQNSCTDLEQDQTSVPVPLLNGTDSSSVGNHLNRTITLDSPTEVVDREAEESVDVESNDIILPEKEALNTTVNLSPNSNLNGTLGFSTEETLNTTSELTLNFCSDESVDGDKTIDLGSGDSPNKTVHFSSEGNSWKESGLLVEKVNNDDLSAEEIVKKALIGSSAEDFQKPVDIPAQENLNQPTVLPSEENLDNLVEENINKPVDTLVEENTIKPDDVLTEENVNKLADLPVEENSSKPANVSVEENANEPADVIVEENTNKPADVLVEENTNKVADVLKGENLNEPADLLVEQNTNKTVDVILEENTNKPADVVVDENAHKPADVVVDENAHKPADVVVEENTHKQTDILEAEIIDKPVDLLAEENSNKVADVHEGGNLNKPSDVLAEENTNGHEEESINKTVDVIVEEKANKPTDVGVEENTNKTVDVILEGSTCKQTDILEAVILAKPVDLLVEENSNKVSDVHEGENLNKPADVLAEENTNVHEGESINKTVDLVVEENSNQSRNVCVEEIANLLADVSVNENSEIKSPKFVSKTNLKSPLNLDNTTSDVVSICNDDQLSVEPTSLFPSNGKSVAESSPSDIDASETLLLNASSNEDVIYKVAPIEESSTDFDEIPVKIPRSFEEILAAELASQNESHGFACNANEERNGTVKIDPSECRDTIIPVKETECGTQISSSLELDESVSTQISCSETADLHLKPSLGEDERETNPSSSLDNSTIQKPTQQSSLVINKLSGQSNLSPEFDDAPIPVKAHRTFEEILAAELAAQENAEELVPSFSKDQYSKDTPLISVCEPVPALHELSLSLQSQTFNEIQSHTALLEAECEPALEEDSASNPNSADLDTLIELCQRQEQELERTDDNQSDFDCLAVEASRISLNVLHTSCEAGGKTSDSEDANSTFSPNSFNQTVVMVDNIDDNCNPFASKSKISSSPPPVRQIEAEEPNPFTTKPKIAASPPPVRRSEAEEISLNGRSPLVRKSPRRPKTPTITDPLSGTDDLQIGAGKFSQGSNINTTTNHSEAGPGTASDFIESGEVFKDPSSFDFLSLHGGPPSDRDLRKESLFVQFDPLVGTITSNSTPGIILPKMQPTHPDNSVQEEEHKQTASPVDTPRTPEKSVVREEPRPKTPLAKNPALANVDKLISFSPSPTGRQDNTSSVPDIPSSANSVSTKSPSKTPAQLMLNETLESVGPRGTMISQEDLIRKLQEHQVVLAEQDKAYQERITELEEDKERCEQNWTKQLLEKEKRIQNLNEQVQEKVDSLTQLRLVIEEYEQTISRLVAEKEHEKNGHEQAQQHLNNMEIAFSDVHSKYERTKSTVEALKKNEEALKAALAERQANLDKMENMYDMLKSHAVNKLEKANQDFEIMKQKHQQETAKLKAMNKKLEIKTKSLEETLEQKAKENQALTAICDELINKVGE